MRNTRSETQILCDLSRVELQATNEAELLDRCAAVLARFCQAKSGRIFSGDDLPHALGRPRLIRHGTSEELLLDPAWQGRYVCCWSIPLCSTGRVAGVMQFGFAEDRNWPPQEMPLLAAAGERCVLAAKVLRLTRQITLVEERERRRLSRELHDDAGQALLCLRLQLETLERTAPGNLPRLKAGLASMRELVENTIVEMRRLIADLSPAVLEQYGLASALQSLAGRVHNLNGIDVRLDLSQLDELNRPTGAAVYRLIQECCNNVVKHASAAHLGIRVAAADSKVSLRVEDDGVGFDPEEAAARRDAMGLTGMRERVALLGGELRIRSRRGCGTRIDILLPAAGRAVAEAREGKESYGENSSPAGGRSHALQAGY